MNVYFSCSITGGRQDEAVYTAIVAALLERGHEVPTAILASPEVLDLERVVSPREVYHRDIAWVEGCDALVAEVSTPSHGVGYEIAYALTLGKPVLCCYRSDVRVSKMITGNDHPCLTRAAYSTQAEAVAAVSAFLDEV
ncbi:MAG TPA: nucleoside 2-deoxyribosyltransferase [Anaerolineaceae bacterium]|nr:nucleoside 2-deoxyribosyltransferase [Anaerolineaceae bacterium]